MLLSLLFQFWMENCSGDDLCQLEAHCYRECAGQHGPAAAGEHAGQVEQNGITTARETS